MFLQKIHHHTKGWRTAFTVFFLLAFVPVGVEHTVQFLSPTSKYYEYNQESPVSIVSGNEKGKNLVLKSDACFYGNGVVMTWYDTVFCDNIKYPTQFWTDFVHPGCTLDNDDKWEYREHTFTGDEEDCRIEGYMFGTTTRGYIKESEYSVDFKLKESGKN